MITLFIPIYVISFVDNEVSRVSGDYSRVPNKHASMLIYSASKNPVRHAYCGRHAANGTLPMDDPIVSATH